MPLQNEPVPYTYEQSMYIVSCRCVVDQETIAKYAHDEHKILEENLRLQRKLQLEVERRETLCRHLSESESSLEMDDER